jgi:hypothetical protein
MDLSNYNVNKEDQQKSTGEINEKICPFQSTKKEQVPCTPQCKIYKHNSHGYECPTQELTAISYALRPKPQQKY